MISFDLLSKDDYAVLFEGFENAFLQVPFRHPTKSFMRFLPKGFRSDKLKRNQMIKAFSDAIIGGELSIREYVGKEIETQFEQVGINDFINSHREEPDYLFGIGLSIIATLLWKNQLRIPGYLVFLLNGIPCPEVSKNATIELHNSFFETIEQYGVIRFEEGTAVGERKGATTLEEERKRVLKLEKTNAILTAQIEKDTAQAKNIEKERDEALLSCEAATNRLKESTFLIAKQEKNIAQLSNEILFLEDSIKNQKTAMSELESQIITLSTKEEEIAALKEELSKAVDQAYSEDVLKRLCGEVLDELVATNLGGQEILKIAKQRFSQSETIMDAWYSLSQESNTIIEKILSEFDKSEFSETQLDFLEQLEDGILIRYAVTKALKAVLFNALERKETEAAIGERFSGNG